MMKTTSDRLCYHQVLPSYELGGAGAAGIQLARFMNLKDRPSVVWFPARGPAEQKATQLGLSVQHYDATGAFHRGFLKPLCANWRLRSALRARGPGLVHIHSPYLYGATWLAARRSNLKRVVHVQLEADPATYRWVFRHPPELIIICARFMKDAVMDALPESARANVRLEVAPNAVDIERFSPRDKLESKQAVGADPTTPMVLMLANLAKHKGQETTIKTIAKLAARHRRVQCWLAGQERGGVTTYRDHLQNMIEECGIGHRVQLLGYRSDAPDLLRAADFLLLPSTHEGLPFTILEAQACETVVLASPTAGIPGVIKDHETGYLIPHDDVDGYADRIEALLTDSSTYQQIAKNARDQVVSEYDWNSYCNRIFALYEEVLAEEGSKGKSRRDDDLWLGSRLIASGATRTQTAIASG